MIKSKKSTDDLLKILKNKNDVNDYLKENQAELLSKDLVQMLEHLCKTHKITKAKAIEKSKVERHYAYQIFNGTKKPSRDRLIMLCIGIDCNLDEIKKALSIIGYSPLYPRDERDSVIIFGILHKIGVIKINHLLDDRKLELFKVY